MWLNSAHRDVICSTNRGRSYTVIGALSNKSGLIHYNILNESNTTETFVKFFKGLLKKLKKPSTIVMDNLRQHHASII